MAFWEALCTLVMWAFCLEQRNLQNGCQTWVNWCRICLWASNVLFGRNTIVKTCEMNNGTFMKCAFFSIQVMFIICKLLSIYTVRSWWELFEPFVDFSLNNNVVAAFLYLSVGTQLNACPWECLLCGRLVTYIVFWEVTCLVYVLVWQRGIGENCNTPGVHWVP